MSEEIQNRETAEPTLVETGAGSQSASGADYDVGYRRPPVATRFKPGRSGNPNGRPKGRKNLRTELKGIINKKITFRDGENKFKLSPVGANVLAHGLKGAKGDARSAGLFLSETDRLGLLDEQDAQSTDMAASGSSQYALAASPPSDGLLQNLDLDRLSRNENVELSRLAEVIDLGGDVTALSTDDFDRFKFLLNKGRGKDVTPRD